MPVSPPRLVSRAPAAAALKQARGEQPCSPASPQRPAAEEQPTAAFCRLCWDTAGPEAGQELISPCGCSGSLKHIHRRCLADWQRTQRAQGQGRRAQTCELCRQPYVLPEQQQQQLGPAGARRRRSLARRALAGAGDALFDALHAGSWPALAVRLWRAYVMAQGAARGVRLGLSGFSAGLSVGKQLIEEQAALLNSMLGYTSGLLGSPYAEMLWCQAVGALFVGMLSELVYTSILGLLGGAAYGFCTGYVSAIKGSVRFFSGTGVRAATAGACLAARLLRGAVRMLLLRA